MAGFCPDWFWLLAPCPAKIRSSSNMGADCDRDMLVCSIEQGMSWRSKLVCCSMDVL